MAAFLSDEHSKQDITPMSMSGLDALRGLRPSEYSYKRGLGHRTDRHQGLIAQDLESIPGAVIEGEDGYKRVDPSPVMATMVKAIQELDAKIEGAA